MSDGLLRDKRRKEKKGGNKIAEMEGFIEEKPDINCRSENNPPDYNGTNN